MLFIIIKILVVCLVGALVGWAWRRLEEGSRKAAIRYVLHCVKEDSPCRQDYHGDCPQAAWCPGKEIVRTVEKAYAVSLKKSLEQDKAYKIEPLPRPKITPGDKAKR
jgi:hypothetical protein